MEEFRDLRASPPPLAVVGSDKIKARTRALFVVWSVGGMVVALVIGWFTFALSGFCICDAPVRADPAAGLWGGGVAFALCSVLCGIGYLLRRYAIALWVPLVPGCLAIGGVVTLVMLIA